MNVVLLFILASVVMMNVIVHCQHQQGFRAETLPSADQVQEIIARSDAAVKKRVTEILQLAKKNVTSSTIKNPAGQAQPVAFSGTLVNQRTSSNDHVARIEVYMTPTGSPLSFLITVFPGALISTSSVLTTGYGLEVIGEIVSSVDPGAILTYYVVLGDLRTDVAETGEQRIGFLISSLILHPGYTRPSATNTEAIIKNNMAVVPLGSAIDSSSANAQPIPVEISLSTLSGYSVDVFDWQSTTGTSPPTVWNMAKDTFSGDTCGSYQACYTKDPGACTVTDDPSSEAGSPVTASVQKKLTQQQALVALNVASSCGYSTSTGFFGVGSSMSYSSHYDFVCTYATKCYYLGDAKKALKKWIFASPTVNRYMTAISGYFGRG